MNQSQQEYYITYSKGFVTFQYVHTTNGGASWTTGEVRVNGQAVVGDTVMKPVVHGSGPLWVVYIKDFGDGFTGATYGFPRGEDQVDNGISFSYLLGIDQSPLEVHTNLGQLNWPQNPVVPVPMRVGGGRVHPDPYLLPDATNPDRLFLVFADWDGVGAPYDPYEDYNCDVYMQILTRQANDTWVAGNRIRVNDGDPVLQEFPSDQFLPVAAGDSQGAVHIFYCDDRRFDQQTDYTEDPRFDFSYRRWNPLSGSFDPEHRLFLLASPSLDPPALDYASQLSVSYEIGDYNGMAPHQGDGSLEILCAYGGSNDDEPSPADQSAIWVSPVIVP